MSDVFASALEGQAIATMISNLRGRIANIRDNQQLEALVIQMQQAYESRIAQLQKNAELLKESSDNYKVAYENHKRSAEKNYARALEFKQLLEDKKEENNDLKRNLVTALSEGLIYKAVGAAARQALAAEPAARQRTMATYRQTVVEEMKKGLSIIKEQNGDEAYNFARKHLERAASLSYLADVSEELNSSFGFIDPNNEQLLEHPKFS